MLCEASVRSRQNVVLLKRVSISDVQGLAESFVRVTRILRSLNVAETSVRGIFCKRLDCGKNEPSARDIIDCFSALFARWRCALEILDFGILAYEGAHVSRFDQHIFGTNIDGFPFPE